MLLVVYLQLMHELLISISHNQDMIAMRTDQVPSNGEAGVTPISIQAVYY